MAAWPPSTSSAPAGERVQPEAAAASPSDPRTSLGELALLFLRLGATSFGGPAAHVALLREAVVHRRRWLSDERFLDLLGAANLIPGPTATEMAIHIGWARRRWPGLVVAGLGFIIPAMLVTGVIAWAYVRYQSLPAVGWLLYGLKPVVLAIVVQALVGLGPVAAHTWRLRSIGLAAVAASAVGVDELVVLLAAGAMTVATSGLMPRGRLAFTGLAPVVPAVGAAVVVQAVTLPGLFWVFCKIGAVLFGSGYVLIAFLRADLVERLHWLSEAQLVDAIAVGQVTPGPVFTAATFVGYLLAGPVGAIVATAGIFLPAFVFVALSGPLVPHLRSSPTAGAVLDGVNVASLALMAVVTVQLSSAAVVDPATALLALTSAATLLRWRPNPTWLILGGAAAGGLLHLIG